MIGLILQLIQFRVHSMIILIVICIYIYILKTYLINSSDILELVLKYLVFDKRQIFYRIFNLVIRRKRRYKQQI